jgi:hypothetical protein
MQPSNTPLLNLFYLNSFHKLPATRSITSFLQQEVSDPTEASRRLIRKGVLQRNINIT